MNWQDFLKQKAKEQGLSSDLEQTLLAAFPSSDGKPNRQDSITNILNEGIERVKGQIGIDAVKIRLQNIYQAFESVCPQLSEMKGAGKLKHLHTYLRQVYSQEKPNPLIIQPSPEDYTYPKEFRSLIDSRIKRFVGREFVFNKFKKFVEDNDKGYFTVIGEPGMGKSAIASKYVYDYHVPCYFNVVTNAANTPETFLRSLRNQLIKRYGLTDIQSYGLTDIKTASLSAILEEVRDRLDPQQPLIIVVDALDEVKQEQGAENILHLPQYLPDKVYFFLTRRPFNDKTEKRLYTDIDTPQVELDLRKERENNQDDLKKALIWYLQEDEEYKDKLNLWLKENGYTLEQFIELVSEKVVDNFMYLVCLMDALKKAEYKKFDLNQLPPKLEDYYDLHWQRMGMTKAENRDKVLIIYTIKEILTPIPKEAIADILGMELTTVERVLTEWYQYFKLENIEGEICYNFYHLSFRSYIESRQELDKEKPIFKEVNEKIFQFLKSL